MSRKVCPDKGVTWTCKVPAIRAHGQSGTLQITEDYPLALFRTYSYWDHLAFLDGGCLILGALSALYLRRKCLD